MRSTFKILFYANKGKEKDGSVPITWAGLPLTVHSATETCRIIYFHSLTGLVRYE